MDAKVGVGSRQGAEVLVNGMQLVAFVLSTPRAGIRHSRHGRTQVGSVQELLIERSQEGLQTGECGGHEAIVQHHLGDDDDVDAVVSRICVGEDDFEINDSKHGGNDDSEMRLAPRTELVIRLRVHRSRDEKMDTTRTLDLRGI